MKKEYIMPETTVVACAPVVMLNMSSINYELEVVSPFEEDAAEGADVLAKPSNLWDDDEE